MPKLPKYKTPPNFTCPECHEPCHIIALDNSFDYAGTHCTHGQPGVHYPFDYGRPVTSCCEVDVDAELAEDEFDIDLYEYYKED